MVILNGLIFALVAIKDYKFADGMVHVPNTKLDYDFSGKMCISRTKGFGARALIVKF